MASFRLDKIDDDQSHQSPRVKPVTERKLLWWQGTYFMLDALPNPDCASQQLVRIYIVDVGGYMHQIGYRCELTVATPDGHHPVSADVETQSIREFFLEPGDDSEDFMALQVPQWLMNRQSDCLVIRVRILSSLCYSY